MNDGLCTKCNSTLPLYLDKKFTVCPHCGAEFFNVPLENTTTSFEPKSWPIKTISIAQKTWPILMFFLVIKAGFYTTYDAVERVRITEEDLKASFINEPSTLLDSFNNYLEKVDWYKEISIKVDRTEEEVKGCLETNYSQHSDAALGKSLTIEFICNADKKSLNKARAVVSRIKRRFINFLEISGNVQQ